MPDLNFFNWIREGVRRSVLLGISDAVEQIGEPEGSELKQEVLAALEDKTAPRSRPPKRRLGRSLKELTPPQ
ncbi:MAG: hypothetical protein JNL67_02020 [Planctomycetaceae bacterium]|nr:hypothetical protein [Planctomycetaceae bacterium]